VAVMDYRSFLDSMKLMRFSPWLMYSDRRSFLHLCGREAVAVKDSRSFLDSMKIDEIFSMTDV
jgi:hypothetical protein